ncbi:MAG: cupin domain-containing protein [Pseudomonadota bacterium]
MTHKSISEEILLDYAVGALSPATAALVEGSYQIRPERRALLSSLEALAAGAIESAPPARVSTGASEALIAAGPQRVEPTGNLDLVAVPPAISRLFPEGPEALQWKRLWPGLDVMRSPVADAASLIRAKPGSRLPLHSHDGQELTLVLSGAFNDGADRYARGDVAVAGPDDEHELQIEEEGECLCFIAVEGDLRLSGPMGAVLSFVGLGKF